MVKFILANDLSVCINTTFIDILSGNYKARFVPRTRIDLLVHLDSLSCVYIKTDDLSDR